MIPALPLLFAPWAATALDGSTWTFPTNMAGECQTVLLAYTRKQGDTFDAWRPHLKAATTAHADHRGFEVAVIDVGSWLQGIIRGGMKSGIKDPAQRHATVPLFTDPEPLNQELGIPGQEAPWLLLLSDGKVRLSVAADVQTALSVWQQALPRWCSGHQSATEGAPAAPAP